MHASAFGLILRSAALFALVPALLGAPGITRLVNPRIEGDTFLFEVEAGAGTTWVIESAPTVSGPWTTVPGVPPSTNPVRVLAAKPHEIFRANSEDVLSVNAAAYAKVGVKVGRNYVGNPLDNGRGNRTADVLGLLPEGSMVMQFSAADQAWSSVNQVQFGAWTNPDRVLPPGEGFLLRLRGADTTLIFGGLISGLPLRPVPKTGMNLLAVAEGGLLPVPQNNDTLYRYSDGSGLELYVYEEGLGWGPFAPPQLDRPGEAYIYVRPGAGGVGPGVPTRQLYFNNYAPAESAYDRLVDGQGKPLTGAQWRAQLYAGSDGNNLQAVGTPRPFLTGVGAGFVDPGPSGLVTLPFTGNEAFYQIRVWAAADGNTFEEAKQNGAEWGFTAVRRISSANIILGPLVLPRDPPIIPLPFAVLEPPDLSGAPLLKIRVGGTHGGSYELLSTTDFITWTPVANVSSLAGAWTEFQLNSLPDPARFFFKVRVSVPQ